MEALQKRLEALEQETEQLKHHGQAVERRLRWWRRVAAGLLVLGLATWTLPSGKAQDQQGLEHRVSERLAYRVAQLESEVEQLEYKLVHITSGPDDVTISGANLHIVNGLGATDTVNGLGNLIVGYQEHRLPPGTDTRTGSHNVIVGRQHNYSGFGGLVVGEFNAIGRFSSVTGGTRNVASGFRASISGGESNTAIGTNGSVSGGFSNMASFQDASVSGGLNNTASGFGSSVSGGSRNTASGIPGLPEPAASSVSGGSNNRASGQFASVSGGFSNMASGNNASVSGGENNTAHGNFSSVSGGTNRSAPGTENWAAGALFQPN